jgi:hypothetical protein
MTEKSKASSSATLDEETLNASAENALAAIARAGGSDAALVEAWVKKGNAAAVNMVAEHGTGAARKAARRGLNVLKARGVAIPTVARVTSLSGAAAPEKVEAWILAPDSFGNVCLVITSRTVTSRTRSAFVFLHDDMGIHRVNVGELSQSQLKDAMTNALPGAAYKPVSVPVDWARYRIAEARKRHRARGLHEPLGFASAQALLEPVPSEPQEHPIDGEGLELADDDALELAKKSAALHYLPEFRGWFPQKFAVDELLGKVGEKLVPGQEPNPDELQNNLKAEVEAATDRYFTPERRAELVRMLKDSMLSVLSREGEVRALDVVAAMKAVENAGLITNPPREVPFLVAFFDKAIAALAMQTGGQLRIPVRGAPVETPSGEGASSESAPA